MVASKNDANMSLFGYRKILIPYNNNRLIDPHSQQVGTYRVHQKKNIVD